MSASLNIVTVNVSLVVAPAPSTLQQTGALISQGATTLAAGTYGLLTQYSDLTVIQASATAITTITWASNVATVTVGSTSALATGQTVVIQGAVPAGYNGTFTITVASSTTFTYALATNPGSETTPGTYLKPQIVELQNMARTFFAQGASTPVYVFETGSSVVATAVAALNTFITNNPQFFYAYLVPTEWDAQSSFLSLIASFEAPTAKTYFFTTTTLVNYVNYTALMKCVWAMIPSPTALNTEFGCASAFWRWLSYAPSTLTLVTPFAFGEVFGVTPYPTTGNSVVLTTLKAANINTIGLGTEGGISNTIINWGTTLDGNDATYWYSVDWVQIQMNLALSNEIINGSNNSQAPLYYNQAGINRLQARAQGVMNSGVAFGLVLPPVTVTAVPFATYVTNSPGDYNIGKYAGLGTVYTPQRGFTDIIFNVVVSGFPAAGSVVT